jgi:hypothetical protein
MKRRPGRLLLIALAWIATNEFLFAGDSLNSHGFLPVEAKFRLVNDYLIVAPVSVNGHGPYDMVVDTGSSLSFIDVQTASEIGLKGTDSIDLYALFGADRLQTSAANLTFAGREFERTSVAIQDLAAFRRMDRNIKGILGWNVLWKFNFLIDYSRRRLEIHEDWQAAEISGQRIPYIRKAGLALVSTVIPELSKGQLQMTLDSGARSVLLYSKLLPPEIDLGQYKFRSSTVTTARVHTLRVPTLAVGAHLVSEVVVGLLIGGGERQEHLEDGILPLRLFRTVYFDNTEGCVVLNAHMQRK